MPPVQVSGRGGAANRVWRLNWPDRLRELTVTLKRPARQFVLRSASGYWRNVPKVSDLATAEERPKAIPTTVRAAERLSCLAGGEETPASEPEEHAGEGEGRGAVPVDRKSVV